MHRVHSRTRRDRFLLAAVVFAVLFAQVLLYPGIDTLLSALGTRRTLDAATWFLAVEFGTSVVFAGVWGALSDRTGTRAPLVRLAAACGAVGYATLAVLPQLTALPFALVLVVRAVQGAGTIGALSLAITMLMDLPGGHGKNMGAAGGAIGLGTALGAPVGGLLYGRGPFVPLLCAAVLMTALVLATGTLADRTPVEGRRLGGLGSLLAGLDVDRTLAVPYAFGLIDRLSAGLFALVGTLYFRTVFGLSPAATGGMLALFFAPFALLQYPFGVLSDRIGRAVPVVAGSLCYGLAVIGVGLAPTVALAALAMVAVGVVGACMTPATMALVTDIATERDRGVAMAGFNAAGSVGFLVGAVLGGTVAGQFGYTTAFLAAGAVEVALALLAVPAIVRLTAGRS